MGNRRHVLVIVQNLPVPLDRRVWLECRSLTAAGYDVSVICPKGPGDPSYEHLEGVRIHKYRPAPEADGVVSYAWEFAYSWLRTAILAVSVFVRRRFHVVQACNPPDTYWLLALAFRPFGVRFVYDQHDLCPEVYASRFDRSGSRVLHRALLLLERASYRVADHVIVTNESYRRVALERGGRDPASVTVVRSGPRADEMRPAEPKPELRRGRDHLIVYLGIMGPQDGVDLAIRAVDALVHRIGRTDVHAAFLGFGDCLDDLRALTAELGLDEWVSFTGRADLSMITDYLSTAAVGLGPDPKSPLNDVSTMNKTMEYMAFGLPVVSFDLAETRVSAGAASVYVPDGDVAGFASAIDALLDDPDRRRSMGEFGRRRVADELDWAHQAPGYVAAFDRVLDRRA